ncbi:hypothetical protein D0T25_10600 [Duganella sp. BJB488]|uniref:type IV pilus modification PilV family protein n=1 Tax=unclassified Duganella TaxID=2636909 RepID=UPI000E34772E|nr:MULTISPECIES: hypothetical protein [unclassified Duganella]RFP21691.1 hypothetical protein D0T26_10640 [Duganella sp. BJB489]RFP23484.1 hypothetical protein D0T25_10600 [Duganella sp. BJB488]RFP38650.1 hypothetical protein D0T24_03445 [Duganella sp. BJB480]
MSIKPASRAQLGLSLVELVMFIVIVGIAVVGVLEVLSFGARSSPDPMRRKQALAIAEGMMEEVRQARFTFCDANDPAAELPTTTSPANCAIPEVLGQEINNIGRPFDNVSDYAGNYTTDAAGNAFPVGYTANVAITADPLGPAGAQIQSSATSANMNVLHITVTVTYINGGDPVVLDGYRTRYAPRSL